MPDGNNSAPPVPEIAESLPVPAGNPFAAYASSPALAIWFDERLFDRARLIAKYLSEAAGFTPKHLVGKPAACFAVVTRSLTWKLDPFAVAQSTYETPGGKVGYEGKLCQAILENSGRLEGPVTFEHYGDWENVKGKYEIKTGGSGKPYPAPTWTRADAKGLGVVVRAKIKGEPDPRELRFDLDEAFPLNSTLWATSPRRQICYAAVRAFASVAAPGLFMGVPFDHDHDAADFARDVTPAPARPTRDEFLATRPGAGAGTPAEAVSETFAVMNAEGQEQAYTDPEDAADALRKELDACSTENGVEGIWESNVALINALRDHEHNTLADALGDYSGKRLDAIRAAKRGAATTQVADAERIAGVKDRNGPGDTGKAEPPGDATPAQQRPEAAEPDPQEADRRAQLAAMSQAPERDEFWSGESLRVPMKKKASGTHDCLAWANQMTKRIREAGSLDRLNQLDADNHDEWGLMQRHAAVGYNSLQTFLKQRRGELGG